MRNADDRNAAGQAHNGHRYLPPHARSLAYIYSPYSVRNYVFTYLSTVEIRELRSHLSRIFPAFGVEMESKRKKRPFRDNFECVLAA